MSRRYRVTFHNDGVRPATVLMDVKTLNNYIEYLGSPRHAELKRALRDPSPDQFRVETLEVAERTYLDGLTAELLIERRA